MASTALPSVCRFWVATSAVTGSSLIASSARWSGPAWTSPRGPPRMTRRTSRAETPAGAAAAAATHRCPSVSPRQPLSHDRSTRRSPPLATPTASTRCASTCIQIHGTVFRFFLLICMYTFAQNWRMHRWNLLEQMEVGLETCCILCSNPTGIQILNLFESTKLISSFCYYKKHNCRPWISP